MSDPRRTDEAEWRARRGRNIAIALALFAFVVIVFVVTLIRLHGNVAPHP